MPRLPRCDFAGRWFHVFNRGIARRPVFETRADIRYFLACLARAVRRGEIEVHAYCILTTHFHLLVRSPTGRLSVAMDRILNAYVRYYNRSRRRDGALFRGRYGGRPVDSLAYRWTLVRYIDRNPVQARLSAAPWEFPHGSAWHYTRERRPRWLATGWVDEVVRGSGFSDVQAGYRETFGCDLTDGEMTVVRARIQAPTNRDEPLDDLIDAAPPRVLAWMRRKAALADGRSLSLPCADARSVRGVLSTARKAGESLTWKTPQGQVRDAWPAAEAYLLRHLAALPYGEVGRLLDVASGMAARRVKQAEALLQVDEEFAVRLAELAREALDRTHRRR